MLPDIDILLHADYASLVGSREFRAPGAYPPARPDQEIDSLRRQSTRERLQGEWALTRESHTPRRVMPGAYLLLPFRFFDAATDLIELSPQPFGPLP